MAEYSVTLFAMTGIDPESRYINPPGGSYEPGTNVFISCAPEPGYAFAYWQPYVMGQPVEKVYEPEYLFTMPNAYLVFEAYATPLPPTGKHAYINNEPYEVYIGDGNNWNRYEPYIGDGSDWKPMQD